MDEAELTKKNMEMHDFLVFRLNELVTVIRIHLYSVK